MKNTTLVMLGAGDSSRFKRPFKKQWLRVGVKPLWLWNIKRLKKITKIKKVIMVAHKDEIPYMKSFDDSVVYVKGGSERQVSLANALLHVKTKDVLVSDVARALVPKSVLKRLKKAKTKKIDCVVPCLRTNDTVIYKNKTLKREKIKLIQTPQFSTTKILKKALSKEGLYTDDSTAIRANGGKIAYIKGSKKAHKITFKKDLKILKNKKAPSKTPLVGHGYDVHAFSHSKKSLKLGGVKIKCGYGLKAHSDGDVLLHAVMDSILGAIKNGDIGEIFPDSDPALRGANSAKLLKKVYQFAQKTGHVMDNIDITVIAQKPKISPHKQKIKTKLAKMLKISPSMVNIKATTTERLGYIGEKKGVCVQSVCVMKYCNWKKI